MAILLGPYTAVIKKALVGVGRMKRTLLYKAFLPTDKNLAGMARVSVRQQVCDTLRRLLMGEMPQLEPVR
jgi:hypothetical protein